MELRDQAVLMRASHHSGQLEVELARRNIPYIKYGGLKFLEAAHIKDVLAVLRVQGERLDRGWMEALAGECGLADLLERAGREARGQ